MFMTASFASPLHNWDSVYWFGREGGLREDVLGLAMRVLKAML